MGGKKGAPESAQIEEEINKAGGFGKYQILLTIIVIAGMVCGGMVIHGLAYLELPCEAFICNTGDSCKKEEFCA
jgi:hypothetical protein